MQSLVFSKNLALFSISTLVCIRGRLSLVEAEAHRGIEVALGRIVEYRMQAM